MSQLTKAQIDALAAMDFDNEIVDLGVTGIADLIGLAGYRAGTMYKDLPERNLEVAVNCKAAAAQIIAGLVQKIIYLEADRASLSWASYGFQGGDLVNGVLSFSSLSGLTRPPVNGSQFLVFKGGPPISSGDQVSRFNGDAILIPGVGIRFAETWESDEEGVILVFSGRTGEMARQYAYYASSFSGDGNKEIFLAQLGTDINLSPGINPVPILSSQVLVFDQGLKTEGVSYTTSGFGGNNPKITLTYDVLDDQIFHFLILR